MASENETTKATEQTDGLSSDVADLEAKATAYGDARGKAIVDAATAAASQASANDAHAALQAAIAKIVSDAKAKDPEAAPAP